MKVLIVDDGRSITPSLDIWKRKEIQKIIDAQKEINVIDVVPKTCYPFEDQETNERKTGRR